jgi:hypothetical protein
LLLPQLAAEIETIEAGQHHIQHHQGEWLALQQLPGA